jgi:hypothetical protein
VEKKPPNCRFFCVLSQVEMQKTGQTVGSLRKKAYLCGQKTKGIKVLREKLDFHERNI